ncbi:MAG TPA: hypothetical protein VGU20_17925 [Stellaceae bacterium]|nr:hypothetical protein [Stellaceae bacterium]
MTDRAARWIRSFIVVSPRAAVTAMVRVANTGEQRRSFGFYDMTKPVSFIAPSIAAFTLLLLGAAAWLEAVCPDRLGRTMAAVAGGPRFKPYHLGENPWVAAWGSAGASIAAPNTPDAGGQRLADHSAWTDSCERKSDTAKPGLSS